MFNVFLSKHRRHTAALSNRTALNRTLSVLFDLAVEMLSLREYQASFSLMLQLRSKRIDEDGTVQRVVLIRRSSGERLQHAKPDTIRLRLYAPRQRGLAWSTCCYLSIAIGRRPSAILLVSADQTRSSASAAHLHARGRPYPVARARSGPASRHSGSRHREKPGGKNRWRDGESESESEASEQIDGWMDGPRPPRTRPEKDERRRPDHTGAAGRFHPRKNGRRKPGRVGSVSAAARRQAPPHRLHVLIMHDRSAGRLHCRIGMVADCLPGAERQGAAFDRTRERKKKKKGNFEGEARARPRE